jgi:hypothetical protein
MDGRRKWAEGTVETDQLYHGTIPSPPNYLQTPIHHEYVIWDMQKDLPRLVTNHGNTNRNIISDKKGYQLRLSKQTSNIIRTFVMKQRSDKRNPMDE